AGALAPFAAHLRTHAAQRVQSRASVLVHHRQKRADFDTDPVRLAVGGTVMGRARPRSSGWLLGPSWLRLRCRTCLLLHLWAAAARAFREAPCFRTPATEQLSHHAGDTRGAGLFSACGDFCESLR